MFQSKLNSPEIIDIETILSNNWNLLMLDIKWHHIDINIVRGY